MIGRKDGRKLSLALEGTRGKLLEVVSPFLPLPAKYMKLMCMTDTSDSKMNDPDLFSTPPRSGSSAGLPPGAGAPLLLPTTAPFLAPNPLSDSPTGSSSPTSDFGHYYSSLPGGKVAQSYQEERGVPTSLLGLPAGGAGAAPSPRNVGAGASDLSLVAGYESSSSPSAFNFAPPNTSSPSSETSSIASLPLAPPVAAAFAASPAKSSPLKGEALTLVPSLEGGNSQSDHGHGHKKKSSIGGWFGRK